MCGATSEQKDLEKQQAAFYSAMTDQYKQVFSESQGILSELTKTFEPILEAGPDQEGFGAGEKAALEAENATGIAENYAGAEKALGERQGAMGGGNDFAPAGAREAEQQELAGAAASTETQNEERITEANYATGRQEFQFAAGALGSAANELNPASFANSTTEAGGAAGKTANQIAEASNSIWNGVIGAVGGIASTAISTFGAPKPAPSPAPGH